jgi:hypothetical protein
VSLLLHAITKLKADAPVGEVVGVRGERLVTIEVRGLAAWVTWLKVDSTPFTREDMWDHHRVVSQVFEGVEACLPARFPTLVEGEGALRAQVDERAEALARQLELVRDACELAVTAAWTTPEPTDEGNEATPGRRYLLRLASSQRRRERAASLADSLERLAGEEVLQSRRMVCPSVRVALSLALLLRRASAEKLRERLARQLSSDVRILVNGPWAPYTFADARSITGRER